MKKQISRISILQSSKVMTALYFVFGFLYTVIGIPMVFFGGTRLKVMGIVYLLGPVLAAVFGFLGVIVFGALYNFLAKRLGGIEFEVTSVE
jgi:hypothetical protein